MDFSLTEEQQLLKDSVSKFLDKNYPFELRRSMVSERQAMSGEVWQGMANLGLLGIPFSEEYGGFGGGGIETMVIMEEMGRYLVMEPYIPTVVLSGGLIDLGAADWQKKVLLPGIIEGSSLVSVAHTEIDSRYMLQSVAVEAKQKGNNWVLNGKKILALNGSVADKLIVSARTSGDMRDRDGVTLFIMDTDNEALAGHEYPLYDGTRALDIELKNVELGPECILGTIGGGSALVELVADRVMAALCAEAVGVMSRVQEMTLEYMKTRTQFEAPISRFQALQHRAVDMFVHIEQAKSMAILAAGSVNSDDVLQRRRAVAAAKEFIGRVGRLVGQEAIQLHGGMGMTDELAVGHYFKRLTAIDVLFGDAAHQRAEFSKMMEENKDNLSESFVQPRKAWKQI